MIKFLRKFSDFFVIIELCTYQIPVSEKHRGKILDIGNAMVDIVELGSF